MPAHLSSLYIYIVKCFADGIIWMSDGSLIMKKGIGIEMNKRVYVLTVILLSSLGLLCFSACGQNPSVPAQNTSQDEDPEATEETTTAETEATDIKSAQTVSSEPIMNDETAYVSFLSALTVHDVDAISKAYEEWERLAKASDDMQRNDVLFRYFDSFFHLAQISIDDMILPMDEDMTILDRITEQSPDGYYSVVMDEASFSEDAEIQISAMLRNNGYAAYYSEGGYYLSEDPDFLSDKCSPYLSEGLKTYLELRSTYLKTGAVIDDAGLCMTWDELSDRIIAWESYAESYPDTPEAEAAKKEAENCFDIYLTCRYLDNTPMFQEEVLTDEVRESYERFITTYPSSKYHEIITTYYNILEEKDFFLSAEATDYLSQNNLDISLPDYAEMPTVISSSCFYPLQASKIQTISIVMTEGEFSEQLDAGPYSGWNYVGNFVIEGKDADGNLVSSLDLNEAFGGGNLVFGPMVELAFEDYNQDGNLDFTVGQWGTSNGFIYRLFSVNQESEIVALPIEDDLSIFSACFDYSTFFEKAEDTVFLVPFYDNTVGKSQIAYYSWDGISYQVTKTEISEE